MPPGSYLGHFGVPFCSFLLSRYFLENRVFAWEGYQKSKPQGHQNHKRIWENLLVIVWLFWRAAFYTKKLKFCEKRGPFLNLCLNRISGSLGFPIFALGAPDAPKTLQIWKKTSPRRQNRWKLKPQGLINRCEFTEKSLKSGLDHRCTTYEKYKRMPWDFPNGGPSSKVYIYMYVHMDIGVETL